MREVVDLNSDLGEGGEHDEEILELVTSANIACGFHAGDPASIFDSIRTAKEQSVAVGAHPGLADRENFGRAEVEITASDVFTLVTYQVGAFKALCAAAGTEMRHVKAHGALYNMATRNLALAQAIAQAVLAVDTRLTVFVPRDARFRRGRDLSDRDPRDAVLDPRGPPRLRPGHHPLVRAVRQCGDAAARRLAHGALHVARLVCHPR